MPRPSVQIFQQILNTAVVPAEAQQASCIVGPAYHFFDKDSDAAGHDGYAFKAVADTVPTVPLSAFGFLAGTHAVDVEDSSPYKPSVRATNLAVLLGTSEGVTVGNSGLSLAVGDPAIHTISGIAVGSTVRVYPQQPQELVFSDAGKSWLSSLPRALKVGDVLTLGWVVADADQGVAAVNGTHRIVAITETGFFLAEDAAGALADRVQGAGIPGGIAVTINGEDQTSNEDFATLAVPHEDFYEETVVRKVNNDNSYTLAAPLSSLGTPTVKVISKISGELELAVDSTDPETATVTLEHNANVLKITSDAVEYDLESATLYVSWRGVINNLPSIAEFGSIPESAEFPDIGRIDPRNPLAMGVACAISNAGGVKIKALALSEDTTAAYVGALNKLNSAQDIYCMVPLSSDLSGVIAPYKQAAVSMSDPKKSQWRIVIGASEGVPEVAFVGPTPGEETESGALAGVTFTDLNATFVTDGAVSGDLVVNSTNGVTIGTIADVVSEVELTLVAEPAPVNPGADAEYTIQRSISGKTNLQVAELKARIASVADKRLTMVYPGTCKALGFENQPGTYAAAALGGLMAGTPAHQPLNQLGLAAINQIYDSNLLFSNDEIDELGDGGYFVLVQDSISGAPYTVHQVTTGQLSMPGVQEFSELSVVANFDFVSSSFKSRLDPYIGVWNVIPEALSSIRSSLEGGIDTLRTQSLPRIGSPLISGKVLSVQGNPADAGRLDVSVEIQIPKVLNKLVVYLTSI